MKGKNIIILILVVITGFLIRENLERIYDERQATSQSGEVNVYDGETRVGRELDYAAHISEDHKVLGLFREVRPEAEGVVAFEEDITNDGSKDVVIIFETMEDDEHSGETNLGHHKHVRLTVAINSGDDENYKYTEPIPAPVENQKVKFQDIDIIIETRNILYRKVNS